MRTGSIHPPGTPAEALPGRHPSGGPAGGLPGPDQVPAYRLQIRRGVVPGLVDDYKVSPLEEELTIRAEREDSFANDRSFAFEDAFRAVVKAVMGADMGEKKPYEFLDDDTCDALSEAFPETDDGCMNGGHMHQLRNSQHRSVSALRRKLRYVWNFFAIHRDSLRRTRGG
nr:hypothetical protein [uncultured Oscillibacter sp.]